jgi:hypothetical protein
VQDEKGVHHTVGDAPSRHLAPAPLVWCSQLVLMYSSPFCVLTGWCLLPLSCFQWGCWGGRVLE